VKRGHSSTLGFPLTVDDSDDLAQGEDIMHFTAC